MSHHITAIRTYVKVFLLLMVLTAITVWVAYLDMGILNTFVAVTIAVIKALLVLVIFMHLRHSARILWLGAGAGAVWMVVMLALTLSDYRTRNWLTQPEPWQAPPAQEAPAAPAHH
jgi:cytochrome c oxidase subunit 4